MTDIKAFCKTCRKDVTTKEIIIGLHCTLIVLACGHERHIVD